MSTYSLPGLPHLNIGNIYCIGRNYVEHAYELNSEPPDQPIVFLKPTNSVIFDGDSIQLPPQSNNVHHEVELVVAVEKAGKNISKENALDHIAGFAVGIDVTARDIQQQAKDLSHPWAVAKGFDTFAPLSSFVTWDQISDPQDISLKITVNGITRQSDSTKLMIFPVAELISYLSDIFTLQPGDLIFTGTPKGVSQIKSGDAIKATLDDGIASLSVTVK
jgi:2-keto-4-pentenoate hydratase/2-oxohepta-3-ene-1,7-dioic acid hydratase in catechol pathway